MSGHYLNLASCYIVWSKICLFDIVGSLRPCKGEVKKKDRYHTKPKEDVLGSDILF
jgi:hypothetical protein